MKTDHTLS